jgi:hypothetical protein
MELGTATRARDLPIERDGMLQDNYWAEDRETAAWVLDLPVWVESWLFLKSPSLNRTVCGRLDHSGSSMLTLLSQE